MVGVSLFDQMVDNRFSVCCIGLCYGHRRARRGNDDGESALLENDVPGGVQNHTGFLAMLNGEDFKEVDALATEIAAQIETDVREGSAKLPPVFRELRLDTAGITELVAHIVDRMEAAGLDPRADYADLVEDEDEFDDMDDDDDDDEFDDDELDDRWDDDDDDSGADPTPRNDGGYWSDPNDPTA
jgi:hypothetical protein